MLFVLFACVGEEPTLNVLEPELVLTAEELDFGEVKVEEELIQTLQIVNSGQATLIVDAISITGDGAGMFSISEESFEIPKGEFLDLSISFIPADLETYSAQLEIISDDKDSPELLPLMGVGGLGPLPDIELSVASLDFGDVFPGNDELLFFNISNVGDALLKIEDTLQTGSGAFELITDIDGQEISPGGTTAIMVNYVPFQEAGDQGQLVIESNDPDEPSITIDFIGNGGGDFSYPEAILSCPADFALFDTVSFDGSGSTDPSGEALEYHWTLLQQPIDSASVLQADITDTSVDLTLDTPGDYQIGLIVENETGVPSAQAECFLEVEPASDIYVTLSWDDPQADFDLHMMTQEDGFFQFTSDCCWCNSTLDLGTSEEESPVLLADSEDGSVAEIIDLITAPNGEYYVRVHYFSDNGTGTADAMVRIYVEGRLVGQYTQWMIHNEVWDVGFIRWPEKVLAEELNIPYQHEGARSCQ